MVGSKSKAVISLLMVGALAGAAFATAARLNINSQGVQAGNAMAQGCQGDQPIDVSYETHFDPAVGEFVVDGAMLQGVAAGCPEGTMFQLALQPLDPGLEPLLLDCVAGPGPIQCESTPGPQQLPAVQLGGGAAVMKTPGPSQ